MDQKRVTIFLAHLSLQFCEHWEITELGNRSVGYWTT